MWFFGDVVTEIRSGGKRFVTEVRVGMRCSERGRLGHAEEKDTETSTFTRWTSLGREG